MSPFSTSVAPVALCLTAAVLAGCGSTPQAVVPADPSIAPPPAPHADERAEVEQAYGEFWRVTWNSTVEPNAEWESEVRRVTGQAFADQLAARAREQLASGIRLYGAVTPHISEVRVVGESATVQDCQDASRAGQADAVSGDPKTVGVPRNPVRAVLSKGTDSRWRVDRVEFPGGEC